MSWQNKTHINFVEYVLAVHGNPARSDEWKNLCNLHGEQKLLEIVKTGQLPKRGKTAQHWLDEKEKEDE